MKLVGKHGPLHGRCLAGAALRDRAPKLETRSGARYAIQI